MKCLLCHSPSVTAFEVQRKPLRRYFLCAECDLIFRDPRERLGFDEEKERYDMHENVSSEGYVQFLEPVVQQVDQFAESHEKFREELQILDFGCGPTAFLSKLLAAKKYEVANYDIFYYTNQSPLQRTYDIILSTEVWEHFYHPLEEIEQLTKLLKPGGMMVILTSAHEDLAHFEAWHYRRDPTHVVFFSELSMKWLANKFGLTLETAASPLWVFKKEL